LRESFTAIAGVKLEKLLLLEEVKEHWVFHHNLLLNFQAVLLQMIEVMHP